MAGTTSGVHGSPAVPSQRSKSGREIPVPETPPGTPDDATHVSIRSRGTAERTAASIAKTAIPGGQAKNRRPRLSAERIRNSRQPVRMKAGPTGPARTNDPPAAA